MSPREKRELREAASELRIELALLRGRMLKLKLDDSAGYMSNLLTVLKSETKSKTGAEL